MSIRQLFKTVALALACLGATTAAHAQSAVAGQVTDATGAVLPGVSVEAKSPALIEGAKTAVTDGEGRYQIQDLRPGVYTVTFALQGFSTVVRDGLELPANFTAPISVQLKVGDLTESITVAGDSPLIDVQRTVVQQTLSREVIDSLPTSRSFWSVGNVLPSVVPGRSAAASRVDVGGSTMMNQGRMTSHGSDTNDMSLETDGVPSFWRYTWVCMCIYQNENAAQEIVYQTSGQTAESAQSGIRINLIPKEGGNRYSGSGFFNYSNHDLYWSNVTPELIAKGLEIGSSLDKTFDYNAQLGGPVLQNKLWFFTAYRKWGYNQRVANTFDFDGSQGVDDNFAWNAGARLTWQVNSTNKIGVSFNKDPKYQHRLGLRPLVDPIATTDRRANRHGMTTAKWTSTLNTRLLAETGYTEVHYGGDEIPQAGVRTPDQFPPFGDIQKVDLILGTTKVANDGWSNGGYYDTHTTKSMLSWVTGSMSNKSGVEFVKVIQNGSNSHSNGDMIRMNYAAGVPVSVVVGAPPTTGGRTQLYGFSVFEQFTKTVGRATLSAGGRYEYFNGDIAARDLPGGRFMAARQYEAVDDLPNWTQFSPRFGVAYDVFGDAKTALKLNLGRYSMYIGTQYVSTYAPSAASTDTRDWTDRDVAGRVLATNGDDIAQDNEIGPSRNALFGTPRRTRFLDPDSEAPYQWVYDASVQHQVLPRLSMSFGFYARDFRNLLVTHNVLVDNGVDYSRIDVPNPYAGGTVAVYNISAAKRSALERWDVTSETDRKRYRGIELDFEARLGAGLRLAGGWDMGRTTQRSCDVEDPNATNFCDQFEFGMPFLHTFKVNGSYPLPWGFQAGATLSSIPGIDRIVNYVVTRSVVPTLTNSTVTVRVNQPGQDYYPRITMADLQFQRTFKLRSQRFIPEVKVHNLFGANPILGQVDNLGPTFNNVTDILLGRSVKFGARWDF